MPEITLDDATRMAAEHRKSGRLAEARELYEQILAQRPNDPQILFDIASVITAQGLYDEAIALYEHLATLGWDERGVRHNLGVALLKKDCLDEALSQFQRVLELDGDFAPAHVSIGNAQSALGDHDRAIASYERAISLRRDLASAHYHLGVELLRKGNFEGGWREFEWRKTCDEAPNRRELSAHQEWDGSDLAGRTILLHSEQVLKDTIQFIRYVPMVVARGGVVKVECQAPLKPLLEGFPQTQRIIAQGEDRPPFDVHCSLMSLPYLFGTTLKNVPMRVPYLHPDAGKSARWKRGLTEHRHFKVGLAWAGRTEQNKGLNRLFLTQFAPLAAAERVLFFPLQRGRQAAQAKEPPEGMRMIDCAGALVDLTDTASLIANLDLIISADLPVAHLAGAMGKPVWTLLPFTADWRWMIDRRDTPWYPTMRLFRQPARGDWTGAVTAAANELAAFTRNFGG